MMGEFLFDHLLHAVHRDLERPDLGRLPDLRDVFHVPYVEGCPDVDHGSLAFVRPDVRSRIEDLEAVQVPRERGHVRLDLDRGLVEGDEQARFLLAEPVEEELDSQNRLAAAGRA